MKKITESQSWYEDLENMSIRELLQNINSEDKLVAHAVEKAIPAIEKVVKVIVANMKKGGRLFYIGAGTSGRLGILDASECPPTYGIPHGVVVALIAGGDKAIRKAVEFAEDDIQQGWIELLERKVSNRDVVIGIAASGSTPYVIGAVRKCREAGIVTACIVCNKGTELAKEAEYKVEVLVGPEFVTGSTRMKSGTAQKMVLNMISTSVMIQLGRVQGNRMVDMALSNDKLIERGTKMVAEDLKISEEKAQELLLKFGSVRKAIESYNK